MKHLAIISVLMLVGAPLLAACAESAVQFQGITARSLDGNQVQFIVITDHSQSLDMVAAYAECAAAGYAVRQGATHTLHIKTLVTEETDRLIGEATYEISSILPSTDNAVDANRLVSRCRANRIPVM